MIKVTLGLSFYVFFDKQVSGSMKIILYFNIYSMCASLAAHVENIESRKRRLKKGQEQMRNKRNEDQRKLIKGRNGNLQRKGLF